MSTQAVINHLLRQELISRGVKFTRGALKVPQNAANKQAQEFG